MCWAESHAGFRPFSLHENGGVLNYNIDWQDRRI